MGMAASQARYLGLTARKTNTEWEGQQINQQRTALANQSANLFNQLLTMEVPTPPSKDDYTNIQYSFSDGNNDQVLESYQQLNNSDPDYNYMVTHYYYADKYTGSQKILQDPQVQRGLISTKSTQTATSATTDTTNSIYTVELADGSTITYKKYNENTASDTQKAKVKQLVNDGYLINDQIYFDTSNTESFVSQLSLNSLVGKTTTTYNTYGANEDFKYIGNSLLTGIQQGSLEASDKTELEQIRKDFPESAIAIAYQEGQQLYKFQKSGVTYYTCASDLSASYNSAIDPTKPIEAQSTALKYYNAIIIQDKVSKTEKALIETDGNGRFTSVKLESDSVVYTLNTETVTDDISYEDAMNQYNYAVAVYEKEVADINAKTEKIQQQDRTLELRLKQLDTEQNALATEMEAVKKVIDDNVKATFKTFND